MSKKFSPIKRVCASVLIAAQILLPISAQAGVSQLPPMVKPNVPPNIMFTLDDSGSMLFEYMPDNLIPGLSYLYGFPQPASVYRNGDTFLRDGTIVGFGDGTGENALNMKVIRFRSPDVNQIYYDPATKYEPWKNADGTSMPNADPAAAYFNPVAPTGGALQAKIDLTSSTQGTVWGAKRWLNATNNGTTNPNSQETATNDHTRDFYPATYFKYVGGTGCGSPTTATNTACFSRVEIKLANAPFPKLSADRTECAEGGCTYAQEIQNFANWFQYWRNRLLMARGGVGSAFSKQASNLRVGFAAINAATTTINSVSSDIIVAGVTADFAGTNRTSFYNQLYKYPVTQNGTPLRYAMDKVGQYFKRTDIGGPWQNTINDSASGQASCRQNYHILMTDGTWNGSQAATSGATANVDGTNGSIMTAADGRKYQYKTTGGVLTDPQGNITTLSEKQYADSNSNTLADVAMYYWVNDLRSDWGTSKKNVPTNAADPAFWQHLVSYTVGLGVNGTLDPAVDLPALTAGTKVWSTPGSDSVNNVDDLWHAAVNGRGQYFSAQNPKQFADGLSSALQDIASRAGSAAAIATSNNTLGANVKLYTSSYRTDNWSGKLEQKSVDQNTGNIAANNDWDTDNMTVDHATRKVFSSDVNGSGGIEFKYGSLLPDHRTLMDNATGDFSPTVVTGTDIVNYIRGDKSLEGKPFRIRNYVMGDLVNSDPQYVREGKDGGYTFLPAGSIGKGSYQAFLYWKKSSSRAATVYVGANDGMMHAFDVDVAEVKAQERFAYVPQTVIPNLPELAKKNYTHRFYVDATPNIADAAIGPDNTAPWRMVLLSGMGAGGKGIFALDVTDPTLFDRTKVLWERSSTFPTIDVDMGYSMGVPQMGRMRDGRWVAVYGNGYESGSGKAMLYVVDLKTGAIIYKVDTGTSANGLSTPKLVLDSESTIRAAYAGDIQGNLWKFNFVTAVPGDPTTVSLAFGAATPLFFATDAVNGTGRRQPITTQPQIYAHPMNGVMVVFGTGKIYEDTDPSSTAVETLYGIWDKSASPSTVTKSMLVGQALAKSGGFYTIPSPQTVDWGIKRGWYISLNVTTAERLVTDPILLDDQAIFTTLVPGTSTDPCVTDGLSTTLQFSPLTGGPLSYKTVDTNGDGQVTSADTMAIGRQSTATMGTTIIRTGNSNLKMYQAASKDGTIIGGLNGQNSRGADAIPTVRLWRQINIGAGN